MGSSDYETNKKRNDKQLRNQKNHAKRVKSSREIPDRCLSQQTQWRQYLHQTSPEIAGQFLEFQTLVHQFQMHIKFRSILFDGRYVQVIWAKLTRCAKAYRSSGSVVTLGSTNRAWRRVTSFRSKRVSNYATPPRPVPWRHLVNDIDLCSPKSLKSLTPACAGLHEPRGSGLKTAEIYV